MGRGGVMRSRGNRKRDKAMGPGFRNKLVGTSDGHCGQCHRKARVPGFPAEVKAQNEESGSPAAG